MKDEFYYVYNQNFKLYTSSKLASLSDSEEYEVEVDSDKTTFKNS